MNAGSTGTTDQVHFYVLHEQSFDGVWEWVRINRPMTFAAASKLFDDTIRVAKRLGYRHVQIRTDSDQVVAHWADSPPPEGAGVI